MKKYILKKVMKRAWEIKKQDNRNIFSLCLKMAWAEIKNLTETAFYGVKSWFLSRTLSQNERYAYSTGDGAYIAKETEKAVLVKNMTDFGQISFWCPKSCLLTKEDVIKNARKMENGLNYNRTLIQFAKESGIKGIRKGMKTKTLLKKISEAGFEAPTRL